MMQKLACCSTELSAESHRVIASGAGDGFVNWPSHRGGCGVGKASRGKRERSRDRAGQWTVTGAAREAHRLRELTQRYLTGNPWVQMTLASNLGNVVGELHQVLLNSDLGDMAGRPEGVVRDAARAWCSAPARSQLAGGAERRHSV